MEDEEYGSDSVQRQILQMAAQREIQLQLQGFDEDWAFSRAAQGRHIFRDRLRQYGYPLRRRVFNRR